MELHLSRDEAVLLAEVLSTVLRKLRADGPYTGDYALDESLSLRTARVAELLERLERAIGATVHVGTPPVEMLRCDARRG
jgi:hypothetical protein